MRSLVHTCRLCSYWMWRHLAFPLEGLVYGPAYAWLQHTIRSPEPVDEHFIWNAIASGPPPAADFVQRHWPLAPLRRPLLTAKMRQDHARGIAAHYDVSNAFYELFLDKRYMFYTCADFHSPNETLEDAQQHKADFILAMIDPKAGERILELGCGWGAMLRRIYEATGDKENLYGLTLSQEQVAHNREHHGFNVEYADFITRQYPREHYDAIYSIGAWEHVRQHEIEPLLARLYAALKPGGRLVKHFFCNVNDVLMAQVACSQIYFPGSLGSPYRFIAKSWQRAGFRVTHRSIHDYRPTLRAWFVNLVSNRERALQLVDVHTYNRYVTFFPTSWKFFDDNMGMVTRWVLEKPR